MGRKFGLSFSAKRAVGISAMKGRIATATGVPLTKGGRQRKAGQMAGCAIPLAFLALFLLGVATAAVTAA